MTILLFLLDTSASMAQSSYTGLTYLDHARAIIASLRKAREALKFSDRYMLVTTEDFPRCLKAGFRESSQVFEQQCSSLRPQGKPAHLGHALLNSLKYINTHRATQQTVDNYGMGRWTSHNGEPVVIITVTDSVGANSVSPEFQLAFTGRPSPASEFTDEAFRWDQRIYSVVLRIPSSTRPPCEPKKVDIDSSPLERICSQTGGRSFAVFNCDQIGGVTSHLMSAFSTLGSNIRFESIIPVHRNGQDRNEEKKNSLASRLEMRPISSVFIKGRGMSQSAHWPIPENFYPKQLVDAKTLPPRTSIPRFYVAAEPADTHHLNVDMPFDKYDVEPGPLTEYILEKQNIQLGWQVFMQGSSRYDGYGKPFGYLKAASNLQTVYLYILPYNYPQLLTLVEKNKADPRYRNNQQWRTEFQKYLDTIPVYYLPNLKRNLKRYSIPLESLEDNSNTQITIANVYNPEIVQHLSKIKYLAKDEFDHFNKQIGYQIASLGASTAVRVEKLTQLAPPSRSAWGSGGAGSGGVESKVEQKREEKNHHHLGKKSGLGGRFRDPDAIRDHLVPEFENGFQLTLQDPARQVRDTMFRNPFLLRRSQLISSLPSLKTNFEQSVTENQVHLYQGGMPGVIIRLQNAVELHAQPIAAMGVYDMYMKSLVDAGARPRPVEPTPVQHTFGNPYNKDKRGMGGVDEIIEDRSTAAKDGSSRKERKSMDPMRTQRIRRKAGPLGAGAMQTWRERRKTISEASSVVSDLSYTSDLDVEMKDAVDEEEPMEELNGLRDVHLGASDAVEGPSNVLLNGNGAVTSDADADMPPAKKARLDTATTSQAGPKENGKSSIESGNGKVVIDGVIVEDGGGQRVARKAKLKRLQHDELTKKKLNVVAMCRRIPSHALNHLADVLKEIDSSGVLHPADRTDILSFASREAGRFKRTELANHLMHEAFREAEKL